MKIPRQFAVRCVECKRLFDSRPHLRLFMGEVRANLSPISVIIRTASGMLEHTCYACDEVQFHNSMQRELVKIGNVRYPRH